MKRLSITIAVAMALIIHASCAQRPAGEPLSDVGERLVGGGGISAYGIPTLPQSFDHPVMMTVEDSEAELASAQAPAGQEQERVALPPGHPDISQMGMPKRPAAGQMEGLPPGHPDISQMMAQQKAESPAAEPKADAPKPEAQAADGCCPHEEEAPAAMPVVPGGGTMTIQVRQGSGDAPAITGGTIHLELHQQNRVLHSVDVTLDANAKAVVDDLPVYMQFQPVLKMMYAGVEYQHIARTMGPAAPSQQVEMVVFESTEEAPDWQIRMRHVMASPMGEWLQVSEIIAFENPLDRAWLGREIGEGRRASFEIPLPKSARDIQVLEGFHACCVRLDEDRLVSLAALLPGQSQYQIAYLIPIRDGAAELTVTAPVATKQLAVFLPDDPSEVTAEGLTAMGTTSMGEGNAIRLFRAGGVPANQAVGLNITGMTAAVAAAANEASANMAKIVAGIGGLVIVLFGGVFLFARSGKSRS